MMLLHIVPTYRSGFYGRITQWLLVILFLTALSTAAQAEATLLLARIEHPQPAQLSAELEGAGYDVLEGSLTASSLDVVVTDSELETLRASGLQIMEIESGQPLQEMLPIQDGSDAVPNGYRNLQGINERMGEIAAAFPDIAQVIDLTTTYGVPETVEGRHLYALLISDNVDIEEDEPAMMIVSNHHAREIVTPVIALDAMDRLTQGYMTDPQITDLVDNNEIWIAPTWNPDGYNHVITRDNLWRKNRRRFNSGIGVDQNRNYPQGWSNGCSGSSSPSSNTYKGPSPASEAETQTMIAWSQDQRFAKVIDYHSSGREALYGYSCSQHPFATWLRNQAVGLSNASGYGATRGPSADGEHYQWQLAQMGSWSFLIETANEFQPSFNSAKQESNRVWPGILHALERPISLSGHVTNALTGDPLEADIELLNVNFRKGESNGSGGPFGRYHIFAPPDTYDVEFSAAGYQTEMRTVTIASNTTAEMLNVQLQPESSVPAVSITTTDDTATEAGLTTATFNIRRGGDTNASLIVNYAVSGTATEGDDYLDLPGNAEIAVGMDSVNITIVPRNDSLVEDDEQVILSLTPDSNYTVSSPATATVTIVSDDTGQQPGPDLFVQLMSISEIMVMPGASLNYNLKILNRGNQSARSNYARLVLSEDAVVDNNDLRLTQPSLRVSALVPGGIEELTGQVSIPSNVATGEYFLGVLVDPSGLVTERDESNNTRALPITVTETTSDGPDLAVSALSVTGNPVAAGASLGYDLTVLNQGNQSAQANYARLVLSSDTVIDDGDLRLTKPSLQFSSLAASASAVLTGQVEIPTNVAPGVYFLGVIADPSGRVAEHDESNNTRAVEITVTGATPDGPDLVASALSVTGNPVVTGASLGYNLEVFNQGNQSAQVNYARLVLSTDAVIDGDDLRLTIPSLQVSALAADASAVLTGQVAIPANVTPGGYFLGVLVDPSGRVAESDESNNTRSVAFTVTDGLGAGR